MCNGAGAAAAAAPDRSATSPRGDRTTGDTDLGTHKHGGQAVRMGGLRMGCETPGRGGSGAGLGLQDMGPVSGAW